jgi:heat shock protein HspQ
MGGARAVNDQRAQFSVGQVVRHRLFDYRGVIYDVDPTYQGSDEWYQEMALSRPPRDRPWYHVLVHNAVHTTYVAEQNLEADESTEPIVHDLLDDLFERFEGGAYVPRESMN